MTTPHVTENTLHLEPVVDDPFIDALDALRHRSRGPEEEPTGRRRDGSGAGTVGALARRRSRRVAAAC